MKKTIQLMLCGIPLLTTGIASASCPKTLEEVSAVAPKLVVDNLSLNSNIGLPDLSDLTFGNAGGFQSGGETLYIVQSVSSDLKRQVTGVVKCDKEKNQLVVLQLSWVTPSSYGVGGATVTK
jgi:hypothetical protein